MLNLKLIDPKNTILLVIDIQNDYCSKNGKVSLIRKRDVTPVQNIIIPLKKFIKETENENIPVIFTRMIEDHHFMKENARIKFQSSLKPLDICIPNTKGFDYFKIKPNKNNFEIIKKSYDTFSNPELEKILKKLKIKNIILTGAYTSVCVDSTLRTAYTKGYNVIVPKDLVSMPKEKLYQHNATIDIWNSLFAHVVNSKEIISLWGEK